MENTKSSYPYYPGYKDKEGSTSVEAAELIAAGSVTIREKCFNVIKQKGNFGATADEIAELLNLSSFTVRPRVTELYKQGNIGNSPTGLGGITSISDERLKKNIDDFTYSIDDFK